MIINTQTIHNSSFTQYTLDWAAFICLFVYLFIYLATLKQEKRSRRTKQMQIMPLKQNENISLYSYLCEFFSFYFTFTLLEEMFLLVKSFVSRKQFMFSMLKSLKTVTYENVILKKMNN